tara:strand:+ start:325 stop:564 length:240 start_codon:yes stop_codon:yes gene_type:complete
MALTELGDHVLVRFDSAIWLKGFGPYTSTPIMLMGYINIKIARQYLTNILLYTFLLFSFGDKIKKRQIKLPFFNYPSIL